MYISDSMYIGLSVCHDKGVYVLTLAHNQIATSGTDLQKLCMCPNVDLVSPQTNVKTDLRCFQCCTMKILSVNSAKE